ncbi:cupin domain-containing protein [bacterium]|nr:MAG: cupin domain-containing protein [bacterium]
MSAAVRDLVKRFALFPHPEGGFFKESYRSPETVQLQRGPRSASTAIYFLLPEGTVSKLHRIQSDEVWHFYLGGPLRLTELYQDGSRREVVLGQDVKNRQLLQHVVPAGVWFGAMPDKGAEFSFVGCTVAPGFDFADFELGKRAELVKRFPMHRAAIERLS